MAAGHEPKLDDDDSVSIFSIPQSEARARSSEPAAPRGGPRRKISPLRSLRRHWIVSVVVVGAAVVAAVPIALWLRIPVYAAEATILVSQTFAKNLSEDRELQLPRFGEFIKQQLVTITREEIAMDALERLGERRALWMVAGESRRDAAQRLSGALGVRHLPETSYLIISLQGPAPPGLAEVVNAVADAYLSRARGQPFAGMELRLEALNRHKAQLADEIRAKTELLSRWAKEHGVPGFDVRAGEGPLQEAEKALQAARARRLDAEGRTAAFEARLEVLKAVDLSVEAREALASDLEFMGLKAALIAKKNEHRTRLTGLTAEHEGRKSTEKLIKEIDLEIEKAEKDAVARLVAVSTQRRDARFKEEKQALALELDQAQKSERTFAADVERLSRKAQRFNDVYYDAQSVQQEMDRIRRQLGAVEDRIDLMRLESYAPGFVHLASPATVPTAPTPSRLGRWLGALFGTALLLALGLPVVIDSLDHRVRVPADLLPEIQGALMGLPRRQPETEPFVRDQLRRLALALERERRQHSRRRIVFTGVKSGAGTSQLVLDLALELRNLGVRAAAVEANALKPDPRFRTPEHKIGLIDVLRGKVAADAAMLPQTPQLPPRMPLGEPEGRSILSDVSRLDGVLSDLSGRCELLLIDAPPILLSSDAEMLAGIGDAVVLVVASLDSALPEVRRAVRILKQVGTPLARAVMTGVAIGEGGGSRDYAELIKEYNVIARTPSA